MKIFISSFGVVILPLLCFLGKAQTPGAVIVSDPTGLTQQIKQTALLIENRVETINRLDKTYDLNKGWIERLSKINAAVQKSYKILDILDMASKTIAIFQETEKSLSKSSILSPQEKSAITLTLVEVIGENKKLIKEMKLATTPGKLEMDDKARWDLLTTIQEKMQRHYYSMQHLQSNVNQYIEGKYFEKMFTENLF